MPLSIAQFFRDLVDTIGVEYLLYLIAGILFIPVTIAGIIASARVNSVFKKYSNVPSSLGQTASEIARAVLDENGLHHVVIRKISGTLTDCFDPRTNVISLSQSVYGSTSVAAIGVACHEVGHAIQHAKKYLFSRVRIRLVPVVNFANRMIFPLLLIGMIFGFGAHMGTIGKIFIWAGIITFGLSMLFALITLPTEFNASRRALSALKNRYLTSTEAAASRKVLRAAAMTYVVSFLLSVIQFLRFFALLLIRSRR